MLSVTFDLFPNFVLQSLCGCGLAGIHIKWGHSNFKASTLIINLHEVKVNSCKRKRRFPLASSPGLVSHTSEGVIVDPSQLKAHYVFHLWWLALLIIWNNTMLWLSFFLLFSFQQRSNALVKEVTLLCNFK